MHAWKGDWPAAPTLPLVGGHEGAGTIVAIAAGTTTTLKVGDAVGISTCSFLPPLPTASSLSPPPLRPFSTPSILAFLFLPPCRLLELILLAPLYRVARRLVPRLRELPVRLRVFPAFRRPSKLTFFSSIFPVVARRLLAPLPRPPATPRTAPSSSTSALLRLGARLSPLTSTFSQIRRLFHSPPHPYPRRSRPRCRRSHPLCRCDRLEGDQAVVHQARRLPRRCGSWWRTSVLFLSFLLLSTSLTFALPSRSRSLGRPVRSGDRSSRRRSRHRSREEEACSVLWM